jgi:CRISPR/Cas system type I-B associated protein Csh2 (Cas7 group RAMP superfamily)
MKVITTIQSKISSTDPVEIHYCTSNDPVTIVAAVTQATADGVREDTYYRTLSVRVEF